MDTGIVVLSFTVDISITEVWSRIGHLKGAIPVPLISNESITCALCRKYPGLFGTTAKAH